jgi:uncharacterized protein YcbK (DUF882 family)
LYGLAARAMMVGMSRPTSPSRRIALGCLLAAGAGVLVPRRARALDAAPRRDRWLELASTHTGEVLSVAYRSAAGLVDDAVQRLQHLLRDHRNDAQHPMDTGLYDLLADLAERAGVDPRFQIISGYRSPQTNAALHERSAGVAVRSLHLQGRAIDVRLHGVGCDRLAQLALDAARGGVGYYGRSDFVHVDTGAVRRWQG